jgi:hypothetical protein
VLGCIANHGSITIGEVSADVGCVAAAADAGRAERQRGRGRRPFALLERAAKICRGHFVGNPVGAGAAEVCEDYNGETVVQIT